MDSDQKTTRNWIIGSVAVMIVFLPLMLTGGKEPSGELTRAAQESDIIKVKQLLDNGADPNARLTPVRSSFFFRHYDNEAKSRFTPLMCAALNDRVDIAQLLIDHHADLELRDISVGHTAFAWAIHTGRPHVARFLLDHGAHIDFQDAADESIVTSAVESGNMECLKLLIAHGVRADVKPSRGRTPLAAAKVFNRKEMIVYLRSIHAL